MRFITEASLLTTALLAAALVPAVLLVLHGSAEMPHHVEPLSRAAEFTLVVSVALSLVATMGAGLALRRWRGARSRVQSLSVTEADFGGTSVMLFDSPLPVAFASGLRQPRIYLSTGAVEHLRPGELQAALLHESTHVDLGDTRTAFLLATLGGAFRWFPGVSAAIDRWRAHMEIRADERALARGATRRDLFEAIVRCAAAPEPSITGADTHARLLSLASGALPSTKHSAPGRTPLAFTLGGFLLPVLAAAGAYAWLCGWQP